MKVWRSICGPAQGDDALQMAGLGEKIERLDGGELVAGGDKGAQVAHLGGGVAGHIDDGARAVSEKL